jgi:hypothetical protein
MTRLFSESELVITGNRARVRRAVSIAGPSSGGLAGHGTPAHPKPRMNKLEMRYEQYLSALKHAGAIKDYRFEPVKIVLGHRCTYLPDFLVVRIDGAVEFREVKGFMRDDAAVKLKASARLLPWFLFILVTRHKGEWAHRVMEL